MKSSSRARGHSFWRATGLGLPALLLRLLTTRSKHKEPKKPVVTQSLATAASRCGVHLLPTMVSVVVISLNLTHIFLGRTLPGSLNQTMNMALLQVAAKLQEMLIVASLAALIMQAIRDEMLYGDGVPLGLIGSGFQFSSLSYFWSPDFWGSFGPGTSFKKRYRFWGLLSVTGLIAAFAGPSTAVLLIPRVQNWDAGGSDFYLQNRADELWPDNLTFDPNGIEAFCAHPTATDIAGCPSGGYQGIRDWVQGMVYSAAVESRDAQLDENAFNCQQYLTFRGSHAIIPESVMIGNMRSRSCETSLSTAHIATAITQGQLARDWNLVMLSKFYTADTLTLSEYKFWNSLEVSTMSRSPVVRVACSDGQNVPTTAKTLSFPIMPEGVCWNSFDTAEVFGDGVTPCNRIRTTWTPLPARFGYVSTGLIVELPWSEDDGSRVVSGCSVDARWAKGLVSQSQVFSDISQPFGKGPDFVGGAISIPVDSVPCTAENKWSAFTPLSNSSWSPISLSPSWLQVLTPIAPDSAMDSVTQNASTLEYLLSKMLSTDSVNDQINMRMQIFNNQDLLTVNKTVFLETIISAVVADGLSRHGSASLFEDPTSFSNWTLKNYVMTPDFDHQIVSGGHALQRPPPNTEYTSLNAEITITGFCYKASAVTDFLSIAVLLSHIVLALSHTLWLMTTGRSSSCWDTIAELIALVQNSRPAPLALENTCAGIRHLNTFSRLAIIRATADREDPDDEPAEADHVELLFSIDENAHAYKHKSSEHSLSALSQSVVRQVKTAASENEENELEVYVPRFPTTLTDEAFEQIFKKKRQRGSSSVSIAASQRSLLGGAIVSDDGRRRRSAFQNSLTQSVLADRLYGHLGNSSM